MPDTITIDPASQRRFESTINEMARITNRETSVVIRNTARDFCAAAITRTPIGKGPNRGMARAGWIRPLVQLGKTPLASYHQRGGKKAYAMGNATIRPDSITITNQVPFIEELDRGSPQNPPSHILQQAINDVSDRMERYLTRQSKRYAKAWS